MLLLDTATFLLMTDQDEKLSAEARARLTDPSEELVLHQVSLIEIQIKYNFGKLRLGLSPREFVAQALEKFGITYRNLANDAIWHLAKLPQIHRDPFDRLIISHALFEGIAIVTPDPVIHQYPVRCIW